MILAAKFKTDYFNYLLSVLTPALINALSIPLLKNYLGAENYGLFAILLNVTYLVTSFLSGWITQSAIRFLPTLENKKNIAAQILLICLLTQAVFFIPMIIVSISILKSFLLPFFIVCTVSITSIQFTFVALSQSLFLSKKNIYSEVIRSISYISIAFFLLKFISSSYLISLFSALIISYSASAWYLYLMIRRESDISFSFVGNNFFGNTKLIFVSFFKYGIPISLWFVCSYLITLVDKIFLLYNSGNEIQGNYQALFDFISKSIILLTSPILIALFPLVTNAYQKNMILEIKKIIAQILILEIIALIVSSLLYWSVGYKILFQILKVPQTSDYKLMGLFVIIGCFIWQLAMVLHKYLELEKETVKMLYLIIIALVFQIVFYLLLNQSKTPLGYAFGYMLSPFVYLFLVYLNTRKKINTIEKY